jgi:cytochrome P450
MSGRVNLLAPEIRANPYPTYAELRRHAPVCQVDPGGLWVVSRHDDVVQALKTPRVFSSEGFRQTYRPAWISNHPLADSALVMDPPRHTRLRALINRAFGPPVLTRIEPNVRRRAAHIVEALPVNTPTDFVTGFAMPLPVSVFGELLGLPPELHAQLTRWGHHLAQFTSIGPQDTERQEAMRATVEEIRAHFERVLAERRARLGEDLISDLIEARVEGERLSQTELLGFMFLLLVGGLDTTQHLMSQCALRLSLQPEWMRHLRERPELLPRFVEEVLRHEPSSHGVMRLTTEETELAGVRLPAGTRLLLLLGSANRDEHRFADPERFDPERAPTPVLSFGQGIHFCVGAQLARLQARLSVEALLARFSHLSSGGPVEWNNSLIVRGPRHLPLAAHPA